MTTPSRELGHPPAAARSRRGGTADRRLPGPWPAVVALVTALALMVGASPAAATTFVVDSTADAVDANPGDGACATAGNVCTLRAAIQEANALPGADAITLPAGIYTIGIPGRSEDAAATGDFDIVDDVTITGAGRANTILVAGPGYPQSVIANDRLFEVFGRAVTFASFTMRNGDAANTNNQFLLGGAIAQHGGTVVITDVEIDDCFASQGAGISVAGGTLTVTGSTFSGNVARGGVVPENPVIDLDQLGGGIYVKSGTLTVSDSTFTGNSGNGGAVANDGTATLTNLAIVDNHSNYFFSPCKAGGLFNTGTMTVTGSTVSGNTAGNGGCEGDGPGIRNLGTLTLSNTTISDNFGNTVGGGLENAGAGTATLQNVTVTDNETPTGGGIANVGSGTVSLRNTLVAGNGASAFSGPDCLGTITSLGHNLIQNPSGCTITGDTTGNLTGLDPSLGALADNGGGTSTRAIAAFSPAVDAGDDASCPATDQRGVARPQDGNGDNDAHCDIGAYELIPGTLVATATPTFTPLSTPTRTPTPEPTPRAPFLGDPAAAKAAVKCQQAIEKNGAKLTAARLKALGRCSGPVLRCVQTKPGDPSCTAKAGAACTKALTALGDAASQFGAGIAKACFTGASTFDDVVDASGLGHDANAPECAASFGIDLVDADALAACVARQQTCRSEQLFSVEEPRAQEAMRVGQVSAALRDALPCLPDYGGAGADVGDPSGTGKAVVACAAAATKAGAAFVAGKSKTVAACLDTVLTCVQTQPVTPACFTKAERACAKAFATIASERQKLAPALAKKCGAIDFTALAAGDAAGFALLAGDCAAFGVAPVDSLSAYAECLRRQHECEVEDLLRFRAPRATELLALVGQTLQSAFCPPSLPVPTPTMTVPATGTATPATTATRSITPTPSPTSTPTATRSPTPTRTATPTRTPTPSATITATPIRTTTPAGTSTAGATVSATATVAGQTPTPTATPTPLATLAGPAGDAANDHIPDVDFPDPPPEDLVAPAGIPISIRDLVIIFQPTTTVADANALLQSLPAVIVGGNPLGGLLLVRLTGSTDLSRVLAAQATLLADVRVAAAMVNTAMTPSRLPPTNIDPGNKRWTWELPLDTASGNWGMKAVRMPQAWNFFDRAARVGALGAPSIDALVLEANDPSGTTNNLVSATSPDLLPNVQGVAGATGSNHATMVGGIIDANWRNNQGVEGMNPRAITIFSRSSTFAATLQNTLINALRTQPTARIVNYSAGYGNSFVANGTDPVTVPLDPTNPVSAANPTWRQYLDTSGNTFFTAVTNFIASALGRSNFLMFCSAGNMRQRPGVMPIADHQTRDESLCGNVAQRFITGVPALPNGGVGGDHFISVEANDASGNRASFSATGGGLSAPGVCVRSTELNDGVNYDAAGCATGSDGGATADQNYGTSSGTSFASPYAAGLASYLWSLDPALTYQQLRQVLMDAANRFPIAAGPQGGSAGSRSIDGFAAALGIDVLRGNTTFQQALADVDDGTPDGNTRVDPFTRTVVGSIDTADHRRGDGTIDMRDFRAWRDAYLQVHAADFTGSGLSVQLDGPKVHFKKDLNLDGCVEKQAASPTHPLDVATPPSGCANAPSESSYPRYDLNGDGAVGNWFATTPFELKPDAADPDAPAGQNKSFTLRAPPGFLRDIDVLAAASTWTPDHENVFVQADAEGVPASDPHDWGPERYLLGNRDPGSAPAALKALPDYIHSFDLHIRVDWSRVDPDYESIKFTVTSEMQSDFAAVFEQQATFPRNAGPSIVTIPIWTGRVRVAVEAVDDEQPNPIPGTPGYIEPTTIPLTGVALGEDRTIDFPRFPATIDDLAPTETTMATDPLGGIYTVYDHFVSFDSSSGAEFDDYYLARSLDGGTTFTAQPIATGEERWRTSLAAGASGTLYLTNVFGNPSDPAPVGNAAAVLSVSPDAGQTLLPAVLISTPGTTNVDFHTDVAVDRFERVYVVWAESGTDAGADSKKNPFMIRLRTSDDFGATFSDPVTVAEDANPGSRWFPRGTQVAVTPNGGVHVTWTECVTTGGNCSLFRMLYSQSSDGVSFSAPVEVTQNEFLAGFYDMAADADGNVSVVYATNASAGSTIKYVRIENGTAVRTVDVSQTPSGRYAFGAKVAVDTAGTAWVTWAESPGPEEIYTSRTTDGGATFSAQIDVSNSPTRASGVPSVVIDSSGMPLFAWGERSPDAFLFRPLFIQ